MHYSISVFHATPDGFPIADVALNKTQTLLPKNTVEILFPSCGKVVKNGNFLSILD